MNTVEYDLDTSGGLMPQIQALIAPPASEESGKKKKERETRYRRPGRAVNHDCCDSCKEGGDLICCDRCPAAFHLQCHDPPLSEDDLPTGEWICHRCKVLPEAFLVESQAAEEAKEAKEKENSKETKPEKPETRSSAKSEKEMEVETAPSTSLRKRVRFEDIFPMGFDDDEPQTPLQILISAAACMNPRQFKLPNEMSCTVQLPGSIKKPRPKDTKNNNKKPAHELENGLVPLPAKLCFQCRKSCRKAPLVQCDYCPLLFHADCLDPPLTTLPQTRWMCPNHPEHILEEKLLTSVSLTERVKLWDHFGGHISQDAVKVQFFNKIHRLNPPFRVKRKVNGKPLVKVPEAIKAHYANPPRLLPRLRESMPMYVSDCQSSANSATPEEQENWLSSVVSLQTSLAKYLAQKQLKIARTSDSDASKGCGEGKNALTECKLLNGLPNDCKSEPIVVNGPVADSDDGDITCIGDSRDQSDIKDLKTISPVSANQAKNKIATTTPTPTTNTISSPMKLTTSGTVTHVVRSTGASSIQRTLASANGAVGTSSATSILLPRPQSITSTPKTLVANSKLPQTPVKLSSPVNIVQRVNVNNLNLTPAIINLNASLQNCIEGSGEIELSKLDERLVNVLAWQRLQQLLNPSKTPNQKKTPSSVAPESNDVKARAVLCPLSGKGNPVPMPYRTLTVGTGADMDLCLASYGQCNFVSPKHASIFYDEITKHFELLNYSEHGTTVDNVLFSCDFSEKNVSSVPPNSVVASVRKLTGKKAKVRPGSPSPETPTMTAKAGEMSVPCNCKSSSSTLIGGSGAGWEGTALLHHGSYIKFGCLQFIFSVTDYSTKPHKKHT